MHDSKDVCAIECSIYHYNNDPMEDAYKSLDLYTTLYNGDTYVKPEWDEWTKKGWVYPYKLKHLELRFPLASSEFTKYQGHFDIFVTDASYIPIIKHSSNKFQKNRVVKSQKAKP